MDNRFLAEELVNIFAVRGHTLSFAESCTGGLASAAVTDISGASAVFYGGIVSYDNSVKMRQLNVSGHTLESVGAVSFSTAVQMAAGARAALKTDIAVSVTGIAGPDGGTPEKPVGLVYIAVSSRLGTRSRRLLLSDLPDRRSIREHSVAEMLKLALGESDRLIKK